MKKIAFYILIPLLFASCATTSFFRETINLQELLEAREKIEATDNPARQLLLKKDLGTKIIVLENIKVKDVIPSTNVDYDFCVTSDIETPQGTIELYIYTKNLRALSRLQKGKSVIDAQGELLRFFSTLDDYYTKIEIVNSRIRERKIIEADSPHEDR